jgi:hypothetical protein
MNITQIDNNLQTLIKSFKSSTFIYDFLLAYGLPKANKKHSIKFITHKKNITEYILKTNEKPTKIKT